LAANGKPQRASIRCTHTPPKSFEPGKTVSVAVSFGAGGSHQKPSAVRLHYRRVNQAERWQSADMERNEQGYTGAIPGGYSESPYALQYYFEFRRGADDAWLYPGLNATFSNQPYFLIAHPGQPAA
jgi:hypothetical protein